RGPEDRHSETRRDPEEAGPRLSRRRPKLMRTKVIIALLLVALIGTAAGWITTAVVLSAKAERYRQESEQYLQKAQALEEAQTKALEEAEAQLAKSLLRLQLAEHNRDLAEQLRGLIQDKPVGDDGK